MSKLAFSSLVVTALAATAALPTPSLARTFPARSGSSAFPADTSCWSPFGGSVTNTCSTARHWYLPIIFDGLPFASVSLGAWIMVEGQFLSNNVSCRMTASNAANTAFAFSDNSNLTATMTVFGSPFVRTASVFVPDGNSGVVSVDCLVNPGGRVHMASI